jgi:hypothetical protein
MEPVVATGGNRWQIGSALNPPKQAKSLAMGCDRLMEQRGRNRWQVFGSPTVPRRLELARNRCHRLLSVAVWIAR